MRHGGWFFDCNLSPNESTLFKAARLIFLKRERLLILQNYHPSSRCFHDFPPWSSKIGTLKCPGKSGHRSEGTWNHREMWHIFLECHFYLMAGDLKDYFPPFLQRIFIKDIKMNAKKKSFWSSDAENLTHHYSWLMTRSHQWCIQRLHHSFIEDNTIPLTSPPARKLGHRLPFTSIASPSLFPFKERPAQTSFSCFSF